MHVIEEVTTEILLADPAAVSVAEREVDAVRSENASEVSLPSAAATEVSGLIEAPAVLLPKRRARFRLPRNTKADLLARFHGESAGSPRTLVIVAHQDDESIGAGARLARLSDTWVVHVTDGAPPDPMVALRHGCSTREEYAAVRAAEARQALELAGVPPERQISFGLIDGEASSRMAELCMRIAGLMDEVRPDVVVTHAYEGGHTDHDATAFAVHVAVGVLRREGLLPPAVVELTTYNGHTGQKVLQQFVPHERADRARRGLMLVHEDQVLKRRMLDCFESQVHLVRHFDTSCETFRPAPRYIFTRPPHEGPLNYERYGNPLLGEEWRRQARAALLELKLRQ